MVRIVTTLGLILELVENHLQVAFLEDPVHLVVVEWLFFFFEPHLWLF